MLKKLIVVYNPRSSKHAVIEREVLAPARKVTGWLVGKYEVKAVPIAENVQNLAKIISDGDLVIAVGGDGTASLAANGILDSKKKAMLAVMGYGNFNDVARVMKIKRPVEYGGNYVGGLTEVMEAFEAGKTLDFYPLEVKVDGKHWRWAMCYATVGLFAESTEVFEEKKVRRQLKTGKRGLVFSVWQLAKWYFKNRKREFLPQGKLVHEGEIKTEAATQAQSGLEIMIDGAGGWSRQTTDYIALNSMRMARVMRGRKWYKNEHNFQSGTAMLGSLGRLLWFMLRSMVWKVSGKETVGDVLEFVEKATVEIQVEGEYERLDGVKEIRVEKTGRKLQVIRV